MINDKNNNDWDINGLNISVDSNIPTNKLFVKSGEGKNTVSYTHLTLPTKASV